MRDWVGNVIAYSLTDKYGAYNILVPSTYTANIPAPSGFSPNMLTVIINDPSHPTVAHNPKYSQFSYTLQYMPGTTTYLDTPVVPVAAFAGPGQFPVDVEFADGTPVVKQVDDGPYVAAAGATITIQSIGSVAVPNPDWDGSALIPATVVRDYGFGSTPGVVTINGKPLTGVSWGASVISGTVAAGTTTGQLVVERGDNRKVSTLGVTVTVGPLGLGPTGLARNVINVSAGQSIQAAIDAANPGDLILVGPGVYRELVIITEPIQLQGWGAGVTFINAVQVPAEKINTWRHEHRPALDRGGIRPPAGPDGPVRGDRARPRARSKGRESRCSRGTPSPTSAASAPRANARIDGFTIEGASTGGGVFVNGYARYLEVSNNRIRLNSGDQGGGDHDRPPGAGPADGRGAGEPGRRERPRADPQQPDHRQRIACRGRRRRRPLHGGRGLRGDRQPDRRQLRAGGRRRHRAPGPQRTRA